MNPILIRIESALDEIRDYLKQDGGDVRIHQLLEDGTLEVELMGNCESCSMRSMTLRGGIEETVKRAVPEITRVVAITP